MQLRSHSAHIPTPVEHDCCKGPISLHVLYKQPVDFAALHGKVVIRKTIIDVLGELTFPTVKNMTKLHESISSVLTFVQQHDHLLKHFCEVHVVITVFLK